MTVFVVGDVVTDILALHTGQLNLGSDTPAEIRIGGGGSAANTAAWFAATGVPVTLVGTVGDDAAGAARLAELRRAGVHCAVRTVPDVPTGSVVVLSTHGERSMLVDRGANACLRPSDVDTAFAAGTAGDHLHLSGYPLFDPASAPAGRHALVAARTLGMTTSVDASSAAPLTRVGPERFLDLVRGVDVLLANLDEARVLAGAAGAPADLAIALLRYASAVVVKCGAEGAVWVGGGGGRPVIVPARTVPAVVDPTGAGDAFAAGLLAAWLGGAGPAEAVIEGARLGALAVSRPGARP